MTPAMDELRPWLRAHWQLIAAPALIVAIIAVAVLWLRPATRQVSGPFLRDNPAGVVDGVEYAPDIDPDEFTTVIDNPYMPLAAGQTRTYQVGDERVEVTVTGSTRTVMGIETVVVRDREYRGTNLIEDTEDWFAQDSEGNVWYFGEATAECSGGGIANRAGSWEAGVDGAQPGIVMLTAPRIGDFYRQEFYRGHAEDVARVRELGATADHDGRTYRDVLITEDFTALEPGKLEHKSYAPGIGLIEELDVGGGAPIRLTSLTEGEASPSAAGSLCQG